MNKQTSLRTSPHAALKRYTQPTTVTTIWRLIVAHLTAQPVESSRPWINACTQVYALGRETSVVILLQLTKEGAAVDYMESFSASSSSLDDVFIVRGELGILTICLDRGELALFVVNSWVTNDVYSQVQHQ